MQRVILLFSFFLSFALCALAQKNTLAYPEAYVAPLDPSESSSMQSFTSEVSWKKKIDKRPWWVVVDRGNASSHEEPNSKASTKKALTFGKAYYVIETKGDWLYLVNAVTDGTKIKQINKRIGWVNKENLLLWNESLLNPRTKIHLKALMVNKVKGFAAVPCDDKDRVKVFTSPVGSDQVKDTRTYKFYFVYKKEGTRVLLGEGSQLSYYDEQSSLLGWVDKDRLEEWNTRVAIEPNFTEAGYNERKNNPKLRIIGFADAEAALEYSAGTLNSKYVTWQRDPVSAQPGELAKSEKSRFRGDFMRFPLLSVGGQKAEKFLPYFKSAVCDEVLVKVKCKDGQVLEADRMSIAAHGDFVKLLSNYQQTANHFDIMLVVEGQSEMSTYKQQITNLIDEVESLIKSRNDKASVRFGAVVYKDVAESADQSKLVRYQELSHDRGTVKQFIANCDLSNPNSNGLYPVQNLGLSKALQIANFSKYHTNIVIVLGKHGDFSQDRILRMKHNHAIVSNDHLTSLISQNSVNIVAIQCIGGDTEPSKSFGRNIRSVILDAARKSHNILFSNSDDRVKQAFVKRGISSNAPDMADPDDPDDKAGNLLSLANGSIRGEVFHINKQGLAIPNAEFVQLIETFINQLANESINLYQELENWKYGDITRQEGYSPRVAEVLYRVYKDIPANVDFTEQKYELLDQTYFARKPNAAIEPSFSYVLFWPEKDLARYSTAISKMATEVSNASSSDKREKLKNAYCSLLEQFTGGRADKDCKDYTIEELFETIQGVSSEGVNFGLSDKSISCILDTRCMKDEEVEELIKRFIRVNNILKGLVSGDSTEFVFKRANESFFWVKIEDTF